MHVVLTSPRFTLLIRKIVLSYASLLVLLALLVVCHLHCQLLFPFYYIAGKSQQNICYIWLLWIAVTTSMIYFARAKSNGFSDMYMLDQYSVQMHIHTYDVLIAQYEGVI